MRLITALDSITKLRDEVRRDGRRLGFIPTMGALHAGHQSLVRAAREQCDIVVASVFVNPLQFAPTEDLNQYPRDLDGDHTKLSDAGCDVLFTTTPSAVYPHGFQTYVVPEGLLVARYEAAVRPGHFRGVATVVLKLLNLVGPSRAYFGRKDAQQVAVVKQVVADLNVATNIVVCPTVREADGLAMSSRNLYLSPEQRASAPAIHRALQAARRLFRSGNRDAQVICNEMRTQLEQAFGCAPDYADLIEPNTFEPFLGQLADRFGAPPSVMAIIAQRVGKTRLIDNLRLDEDGP